MGVISGEASTIGSFHKELFKTIFESYISNGTEIQSSNRQKGGMENSPNDF